QGMMGAQPGSETAMGAPHRLHHAGVVDDGVDLEAMADDARVGEQGAAARVAVAADAVDVVAVEGVAKRGPLLKYQSPVQSRLVHLKHQPREGRGFIVDGKAVLVVVVVT